MIRSQRFLLQPTAVQADLFRKAADVARFAWNWALGIRQWHYRTFGKLPGYKPLGRFRLEKHWNKVKHYRFPWVTEVTKYAAEKAFDALDKAFAAFFARRAKYPQFKSKVRSVPSFVSGSGCDCFRSQNQRINVPRVGYVRVSRLSRWPDIKPLTGRIKMQAGKWYLTLMYDLPDPPKLPVDRPVCGIDLGLKTFATVATQGAVTEEIQSLQLTAKTKRRLKRLHRRVSRKRKGGTNRRKAVLHLSKIHKRIADVRNDFLHKTTTRLVRTYGVIAIEDLCIKGMTKTRLASVVHRAAWGEFRRQLTYKAEAVGTRVVVVDRWFPSSKTCFRCGEVKAELPLSERTFTCESKTCGWVCNRDHNAALNLERVGVDCPEFTPVGDRRSADPS